MAYHLEACRHVLQHLDLPLQLLGLAPELHPPQLAQQQLQMLDLNLPPPQLLMRGNPFLVFGQQQRLQPCSI
jgi:hypothetical protein